MRSETLIDVGSFSKSDDFTRVMNDVHKAIYSIENPPGSGSFTLYDGKKSNGVRPIKNNCIEYLNNVGWKDEKIADIEIKDRKFDSSVLLPNGKYFTLEWETGNISSSHRALNRIFLGMHDGVISGGVLVLPSRKMYHYLTDRVGNFQEIEDYFPIWKLLGHFITDGFLQVIEIEHDAVSKDVPSIRKGTDGRAKR